MSAPASAGTATPSATNSCRGAHVGSGDTPATQIASQPINKIELLSKLYPNDDEVPNLQLIYIQQCTVFSCHPNSDILRLLPGGSRKMDLLRLRSVDLSGNVVGRVGVLPILYTLSSAPALEQLSMTDNYLSNETILTFVELFRRHPSLTTVDLSGNPISQIAGKALLKYVQSNPTCELILLDRTLINKGLIRRIQGIASGNSSSNRVGDGAKTYFSSRLKELLFDARVEEDGRERKELDSQQTSERHQLHLHEGREFSDLELRESASMRKVRDASRVRAQETVMEAEGYVRLNLTEEEICDRGVLSRFKSSNVSQIHCEREEEPMGRVAIVKEERAEGNVIRVYAKEVAAKYEEARKVADQVVEAKSNEEDETTTTKPVEGMLMPIQIKSQAGSPVSDDYEGVLAARSVAGIAETVATGLDTTLYVDTETFCISTTAHNTTKPTYKSNEAIDCDGVVLSARGIRGIAETTAAGLDTTAQAAAIVDVTIPDEVNTAYDVKPVGLTATKTFDEGKGVLAARRVGGMAEMVAAGLDATNPVEETNTLAGRTIAANHMRPSTPHDVLSTRGIRGIAETIATGLDNIERGAAIKVSTTVHIAPDVGTNYPLNTSLAAKPDEEVLKTEASTTKLFGVSNLVQDALPNGAALAAHDVARIITTVASGLDTLPKPKPAAAASASTSADDDDELVRSARYLGSIPIIVASEVDAQWLASRTHRTLSVFSYTTVSSRMANGSQSSEYDPYDEL